jgi:hypothetical protein
MWRLGDECRWFKEIQPHGLLPLQCRLRCPTGSQNKERGGSEAARGCSNKAQRREASAIHTPSLLVFKFCISPILDRHPMHFPNRRQIRAWLLLPAAHTNQRLVPAPLDPCRSSLLSASLIDPNACSSPPHQLQASISPIAKGLVDIRFCHSLYHTP